ncbi:HD domain-containing protein, partial [Escherichia coli]
WWDQSVVLQNTFCRNEMLSKQRVKAWLLFFIALHDIGKFDIRFQYKSAESWLKLNPATPSLNGPSTQMCRKFNHGAAGLYWFNQDSLSEQSLGDFFSFFDAAPHPYESWFPWVEAVTGHHG